DYMAADFLVEQLPPTNSWSTRYLTVPLAGRDIADTYRIIAAEDNTQVTVNATPIPTLNKGQAVQFLSGIPQQIISDKPIFVAQFANGLTFDYKTGDPFMMNITATDQYINNSKVVIPTGYSYNYLTIIAPNSAIGSITLNGSIINPSIFSTIITSGFSSARISISPGLHTITSPFNFGIWAYGFREYESYGFQGGTGINLYTSTITPTITPTRTITSTCTITSSRTITRTFTTTWTSSSTQTITPTRTESPTFTVTRTITPTQTYSFTRTLTLTRTYTFTGTNTLTTTNTISPTISQTIILKNTYTLSHTIIPSETWVTNSPTFNFTYTCSETLTPVITLASTFSKTPTTTLTFTHTFSITLTPSFTITNSSSFTNTVSLSPTISPTFTLTSTMTNTKTITMTVTMNLNKPLVLELKGNFPEQDKINIIFFLSKEAKVNIKIFTVSGEIVLDKKIYGNSGYNCFFWDGLNNKKRKVASGVYIYKITAELKDEKQSIMNKLFIIK
ncbi:MAG: hypothetical protein N2114_02975, partial [Candidatus Goldbacteria bacterium]|nr:hypothetical protein [Candidatus Goldiibacteriota bacterium]